MDALDNLRKWLATGLRDHRKAWGLAISATTALPDDPRVDALRARIVDLLQAIEMEAILGGDCDLYREELTELLDWIERQA